MSCSRLLGFVFLLLVFSSSSAIRAGEAVVPDVLDPQPFGADFPGLDSWATGQWWMKASASPAAAQAARQRNQQQQQKKRRGPAVPFLLDVPRDQTIAFALYTLTVPPGDPKHSTLKLSTQLFPLKPGEPNTVRLEVDHGDGWQEVARAVVHYPGWDASFRVEGWDATQTVPYRVLHGERAAFPGSIRADPAAKPEIAVAVMSCNSSRTPGQRQELIDGLRAADPDLLFFAGDQTYRHTEHTGGWIEFGLQFRDIIRDRPTVTIPDDHDVGQANLWGNGGGRATNPAGASGGYFYPASYVNMVQRQQTAHLPDPVDPAPIKGGIGVYFTRLVVGGIDFAILEDRKFKTGPDGTIPQMGPRPDHIVDPDYDRAAIDLPGLKLLGERQLNWLHTWADDWQGVRAKCALSQTAFCGAVHLHGNPDNRLLADLDCNGWPQSGRNAALRILKRAGAVHLCGDQHLAVVVQHGIDDYRDGPWSFTSPALVNTIYGRWWHPEDEQPGPNPVPGSPLPWTGDFEDGLGNKITMVAYANPADTSDERQRADGYGMARFNFPGRTITFECFPRFTSRGADGKPTQFPGWPVSVPLENKPQPQGQELNR
jgi:3',5'-cyclic AMP phosphodiesterase CpdA